eukprot:5553468-Alexandrium_andersonii.AAC.1
MSSFHFNQRLAGVSHARPPQITLRSGIRNLWTAQPRPSKLPRSTECENNAESRTIEVACSRHLAMSSLPVQATSDFRGWLFKQLCESASSTPAGVLRRPGRTVRGHVGARADQCSTRNPTLLER